MEIAATPRARRTDPSTSHEAAGRAKNFASSQAGTILATLRQFKRMTAEQLSGLTGLTVEQIDRRLPDLKELDLARVCLDDAGEALRHNGFRVWEAV